MVDRYRLVDGALVADVKGELVRNEDYELLERESHTELTTMTSVLNRTVEERDEARASFASLQTLAAEEALRAAERDTALRQTIADRAQEITTLRAEHSAEIAALKSKLGAVRNAVDAIEPPPPPPPELLALVTEFLQKVQGLSATDRRALAPIVTRSVTRPL